MQASLAVLGTLFGFASWLSYGNLAWLVGAVLLGTVVPWTLIVMFPGNKRLERPDLDPASSEALSLLESWGRLHAVRSALSLAALIVFLTARP